MAELTRRVSGLDASAACPTDADAIRVVPETLQSDAIRSVVQWMDEGADLVTPVTILALPLAAIWYVCGHAVVAARASLGDDPGLALLAGAILSAVLFPLPALFHYRRPQAATVGLAAAWTVMLAVLLLSLAETVRLFTTGAFSLQSGFAFAQGLSAASRDIESIFPSVVWLPAIGALCASVLSRFIAPASGLNLRPGRGPALALSRLTAHLSDARTEKTPRVQRGWIDGTHLTRRTAMKNVTAAFGVSLALATAGLSAQGGTMDKRKMDKGMKDGTVMMTGCVAGGDGGHYMLTNAMTSGGMKGQMKDDMKPMSYDLTGGDLKAHVGHKVEVTGTMAAHKMMKDDKSKMDKDKMDKDKMAGDVPGGISVKSVKMIAATCP